MQAGQLAHRQPSLFHGAACDLVALHRRCGVIEDEREPSFARIPQCEVTPCQRTVDSWRHLAVEADLALVDPESHTGRAARVVRRGDLQDDARRAGVRSPVPGQQNPIALAHLAGADGGHLEVPDDSALCHRARFAQDAGEPLDGQLVGTVKKIDYYAPADASLLWRLSSAWRRSSRASVSRSANRIASATVGCTAAIWSSISSATAR
jgi:hypothetical protein